MLANDLGYSYVGLLTGEDGPGGYPGSCLGADVLSRRTFVIAPYCPFQVEQPWFSMYDRSDIPDSLPAAEREPGFKAAIRQRRGLGQVTPGMWREVTATYYGMVSRLDHHLERIMGALASSCRSGRTVTLFFSDHRDLAGHPEHALVEREMEQALSGWHVPVRPAPVAEGTQ